ncbi:Hpr(Ser) kinase/phosphatase [Albidovulum inexpectatum]|uniref:Hpr(Ser) kinase/phosphatase n=1 Tax=Albidovulum inexpectatum TaxID=196587 RepID=A0A2S5JL89_9RHOB|nr:HPr kinase/phosphatase C-terminal domain-containing protein [Albidovulum inexpectatum]PPB82254.1 Hpr(Ser) kinase/phosphatase [Albidovulum inexpectatum]
MTSQAGAVNLHASCVAWCQRGILIIGPSGSGKSTLALALMSLGCKLVSDDRTDLVRADDAVVASAPRAIRGRIEARGVGILHAETIDAARLACVIDMGHAEAERLPPLRRTALLGIALPLLHRVESAHFPAAILQYVKGGRFA